MNWKIFFVLILIGNLSFAQGSNDIIIRGQVLDITGAPIEKVNILDVNTNLGTVTNRGGFFYLALEKQIGTLRISHIGYKTILREITTLNKNNKKSDTLFLKFTLETNTLNLETVSISSNSIQQVYNKQGTYILDYEFFHNNLLLLLIENGKSKLRLVDANEHTLFDLEIRRNPKNLFKDCLGKLHLQYKDRNYPISFNKLDKKGFYLNTPFSLIQFNKSALPCAAAIKGNLFLRKNGPYNKSIIYSHFKKNTKQSKVIQIIMNKQEQRATREEYQKVIMDVRTTPDPMGDNDWPLQRDARIAQNNLYHYNTITARSIYNPLFRIKDSIFIFNHLVDSAFIYDSNGFNKKRFPINYHHGKEWSEALIADFEENNIYAQFKKGSFTYLKQVDSSNGEILRTTKIEKHIFPGNLKIKNGFVYYLYTDPYKNGAPQKMYRQSLN